MFSQWTKRSPRGLEELLHDGRHQTRAQPHQDGTGEIRHPVDGPPVFSALRAIPARPGKAAERRALIRADPLGSRCRPAIRPRDVLSLYPGERSSILASMNLNDPHVQCPKCGAEIPLTEAVARQARDELKSEFEARFVEREKALVANRQSWEAEAVRKARAEAANLEAELKAIIVEKDECIEKSRSAELDLRRRQREMDARQEELELDVSRRLDEERGKIVADARKRAADEQQLHISGKERIIGDLQQQIEILRQRAAQGSQQAQGEVLELRMEELLGSAFPQDELDPVTQGVRGADLLQRVRLPNGTPCGAIIWEAKRTRNWSQLWIAKLKDDQRECRAELAVLVTEALPDSITSFGCMEGVWVTRPAYAISLAAALRQGLLSLGAGALAATGRNDKAVELYDYLTGTEFRQQIEGLMEVFVCLRTELEKEKRALTRIWAGREKQLERASENTARIYGSIQGIAGRSALPDIVTLELPCGDPELA